MLGVRETSEKISKPIEIEVPYDHNLDILLSPDIDAVLKTLSRVETFIAEESFNKQLGRILPCIIYYDYDDCVVMQVYIDTEITELAKKLLAKYRFILLYDNAFEFESRYYIEHILNAKSVKEFVYFVAEYIRFML